MSDDKIRTAREVRARLAAHPAMVKVASDQLELFIGREVLDAGDCAGLIRLIDAKRMPSQLLSPASDPDFRTSESCNLDPRNALVRRVEAKLRAITGIPATHGENIQGQRYAVGQQFKPHHDFFHTGEAYWPEMERSGGQRTWTAMVFLNVPEAGGQTVFPEIDLKVGPRAGHLLIWNNLDGGGEPNPYSLHQGMPVDAGVKYVITKWHRERPWGNWSAPTY